MNLCSQWRRQVWSIIHAHVCFLQDILICIDSLNFIDSSYIASAAWKPRNSSRPVWAGLLELEGFHRTSVSVIGSVEVDSERHHQQRHSGAGTVTTCPIMPWDCQGDSGRSLWFRKYFLTLNSVHLYSSVFPVTPVVLQQYKSSY